MILLYFNVLWLLFNFFIFSNNHIRTTCKYVKVFFTNCYNRRIFVTMSFMGLSIDLSNYFIREQPRRLQFSPITFPTAVNEVCLNEHRHNRACHFFTRHLQIVQHFSRIPFHWTFISCASLITEASIIWNKEVEWVRAAVKWAVNVVRFENLNCFSLVIWGIRFLRLTVFTKGSENIKWF